MQTRILIGLYALTVALPQFAGAQETQPDTTRPYDLTPIVVEGRIQDLRGIAATASQGFVGFRDFKLRPLVREGELLETVPGLIMTQHSGDGKSNQMFIRGFNLDHGTDFSTRVEGMPVNMPTHAHGQGYTDLNFVIPELVDHVEYQLGPYYAELGDFASAGGAHMRLRSRLESPLFASGLGDNGFLRVVAAASSSVGAGDLLIGGELKSYDGPWAIPQDLGKRAGMLRYTLEKNGNVVSLLALGYRNRWNASDQIPRRLVEAGYLGRFDQVDSTLGGESARFALAASWLNTRGSWQKRAQLYGMYYDLDLYSNFTYFLDDDAAGDQLRQRDRGRAVFGGEFVAARPAGRHNLASGVQVRLDRIDVALERSNRRQVHSTVRRDGATELGSGAWLEARTQWSGRFRSVLGLRGDLYYFDVTSDRPENSGSKWAGIVSPKASLIWEPYAGAELYVSAGLGFHSNDARGVVQTVDPVTGHPVDAVDPLARSRGAEIGLRASLIRNLRTALTLWTVKLDSELLFVGDAGTTEASDASDRIGVTWASFWQPLPQLRLDLDASFARARFSDLPDGENRIPGALENVLTAGASWEPLRAGPYAAIRLRHFSDYPLIEDNSVRADATSLVNVNVGWVWRSLRVGASVLNVLDARDSDITYYYASRLPGEPLGGIEDVHFHPVESRQIRFTVSWGY